MANLRPFDLAASEAGEMPVTRDGKKKGIFVRKFPSRISPVNVCVVFESGYVEWYHPDGRYSEGIDSEVDLMLPAKAVELWLNLYRSEAGKLYAMSFHSKVEADGWVSNLCGPRLGGALRVEFPL